MANDSAISIVLEAIDNTGPATQSAIAHIGSFVSAASGAGSSVAESSLTGIGSLIGGLFTLPGLLTAAGVGVAAFATAYATDFGGIREVTNEIMADVGAAIASGFNSIVSTVSEGFDEISDFTINWG